MSVCFREQMLYSLVVLSINMTYLSAHTPQPTPYSNGCLTRSRNYYGIYFNNFNKVALNHHHSFISMVT